MFWAYNDIPSNQTKFGCKKIISLEDTYFDYMSLPCDLVYSTAIFCITLWLMMHHHTIFSGSKDICWKIK